MTTRSVRDTHRTRWAVRATPLGQFRILLRVPPALGIALVVAVFLAACSNASCPNPPVNTTVVLTSYTGTWFQLATSKLFADTFEHDVVCETATYTAGAEYITVNNTGRKDSVSGPLDTFLGKAYPVAPGKFKVNFGGPLYSPYWITQLYGTAEESYSAAVVFSCNDLLGIDVQSLWVLSRTPTLPPGLTLDGLYAVAAAQGINVTALEMVDTLQNGCW
eukprot:c14739_g1_i1.p2 GENE.c14739_g1_i1~~c14739_g1_i1.p2  ORF type:complete len:219 (-),score=27.31 c14739_g1_i1:239-895(-)